MPHILVVDDDREIRDLLAKFLERNQIRVTTARDGREARRAWTAGHYHLVVLDLMLPGESGLDLARWMRGQSDVPIVMLTAMAEETDRIIGLELGADDYLPKPFNPRELLARIRAVLRRAGDRADRRAEPAGRGLRFAGWTLDPGRRRLLNPDDAEVALTGASSPAGRAARTAEPGADARHAARPAARAASRAVRPGDRRRHQPAAPQAGG